MQDMYNWKQNPLNASLQDSNTNLQYEPKADCLANRPTVWQTDRQTDKLTNQRSLSLHLSLSMQPYLTSFLVLRNKAQQECY